MNNPEYIIVDEFQTIVAATGTALDITINYQYGDIRKLNEILITYSKSPEFNVLKFPLVWLAEPFTERIVDYTYYSQIEDLRIYIIQETSKTDKPETRMTNIYKPIILPIYRELIKQIILSKVFITKQFVPHRKTNMYYWGEAQQSVLNDVVDCLEISQLQLKVKNNLNCP